MTSAGATLGEMSYNPEVMRSVDEILRFVRELSLPERKALLEELERLEQTSMSHEENATAWAEWIRRGPQGPIEREDDSWP